MMQFPSIPLSGWQETRDTIQKYAQVLGEIRGALTPRSKHWWHTNLRPGVTGLVTPPIPAVGSRDVISFQMQLDFTAHLCTISDNNGREDQFPLEGQPISVFCTDVLQALSARGINPEIDQTPFSDSTPTPYDAAAAQRFWLALVQIASVFETFRAGLRKETSMLNLWPHHFDMAFVWFSGRLVAGVDPDDEESADEQMSFGFSTGDADIGDPYFYISAYPLPEELKKTALPDMVSWYDKSWEGALLMYDVLVAAEHPEQVLLEYLSTVFKAGENLMR